MECIQTEIPACAKHEIWLFYLFSIEIQILNNGFRETVI